MHIGKRNSLGIVKNKKIEKAIVREEFLPYVLLMVFFTFLGNHQIHEESCEP
jgi:hypothetical protein